MNVIFFLRRLILKLLGFVFCFIQRREWKPALGHSPFRTFLCSHLFLLFVNFGYLQIPSPLHWCNFYLLFFTKAKRLASYKINNYLLSGNVHGLPALSKVRIRFGIQKLESSIGFCYRPQSKLHFHAVFLGVAAEERKRKIDSEWLIASFYQAGPLWKSSVEPWRLNIFPELSNRKKVALWRKRGKFISSDTPCIVLCLQF